MALTKQEVEKIAALARIRLTDEEKEKLSQELGDILKYADKLNEINTKGVEPTAQVSGLENVFRKDDPSFSKASEGTTEKFLEQAPSRKDTYVKVKAVFTD